MWILLQFSLGPQGHIFGTKLTISCEFGTLRVKWWCHMFSRNKNGGIHFWTFWHFSSKTIHQKYSAWVPRDSFYAYEGWCRQPCVTYDSNALLSKLKLLIFERYKASIEKKWNSFFYMNDWIVAKSVDWGALGLGQWKNHPPVDLFL